MKKIKPEKKQGVVRFSFKSSLFVVFGILVGTLFFPVLLDSLGLQLLPLRVIMIGLITGFVVSYSLFFIDSDRGVTRNFWVTFAIFAIMSMVISYFWVYNIYYV